MKTVQHFYMCVLSSISVNMFWRRFLDFRGLPFILIVLLCATKPSKVVLQDSITDFKFVAVNDENGHSITDFKFSAVNVSSLSPFVPQRLLSPGWSHVTSLVTCSQKTISTFPAARGFLYNSTTRMCTPLLWLQGSGVLNATEVLSEEGLLFLVKDVCREDFQILEYGTEGHLACVQDSTSSLTYWEAKSSCNASQAHLVAVKTAEKLDLVRAVSGGRDRWVGLTDLQEEGTFMWDIDGSNMTDVEKLAVFPSNEPNDMNGREDCVQFRQRTQMLNDKPCGVRHGFICEIALPSLV